MRTPRGGDRIIQWVIQYRLPPVNGSVTTWNRADVTQTAAATHHTLAAHRTDEPEFEWRAIRVETVQRIEDW